MGTREKDRKQTATLQRWRAKIHIGDGTAKHETYFARAPLTIRINGVPLRRVSQAYVIATSTQVDISSISIPESVNDAYFAKSKASKSTKEGEFFGEGKEKKAFPEEKKSEQKTVDAPVIEAIKKVTDLNKYLRASWGLSKGDRFHELKF